MTLVPEGWESVAPELLAAQDEKLNALRRAQAGRLRQVPQGPLLVEHANLFDAESGAMKPGSTVLVEGNIIRAVGADGSRADSAVCANTMTPQDARSAPASGTCMFIRNLRTGCCSWRPA